MYDKLVKKIRHCATDPMHCLSCGEDKDGRCFARLMKQAADAIEELSKYAETMMRLKCEGWYLQQIKSHDGCQAIATMPLPQPPKEET